MLYNSAMAPRKTASAPMSASTSKKSAPTSAVVTSKDGGHIRTYTLELHGKDFADLAKQMADQHEGATITLMGEATPSEPEA